MNTDDYEGHTPGPWTANHDMLMTEAKYGPEYAFIVNNNGWRVYLGSCNLDEEDINEEGSTPFIHDHNSLGKTDAQLIAAAPELLAEVKRFEQVKKWVYGHKKYPTITKIHLKDLIDVIEGGAA